jgi:hypothetical protein
VLDLLMRGVAGIHPEEDALVVDPLPMDLTSVRVDDVRVRGRRVRVERTRDRIVADVDGERWEGSLGTAIEIPW